MIFYPEDARWNIDLAIEFRNRIRRLFVTQQEDTMLNADAMALLELIARITSFGRTVVGPEEVGRQSAGNDLIREIALACPEAVNHLYVQAALDYERYLGAQGPQPKEKKTD